MERGEGGAEKNGEADTYSCIQTRSDEDRGIAPLPPSSAFFSAPLRQEKKQDQQQRQREMAPAGWCLLRRAREKQKQTNTQTRANTQTRTHARTHTDTHRCRDGRKAGETPLCCTARGGASRFLMCASSSGPRGRGEEEPGKGGGRGQRLGERCCSMMEYIKVRKGEEKKGEQGCCRRLRPRTRTWCASQRRPDTRRAAYTRRPHVPFSPSVAPPPPSSCLGPPPLLVHGCEQEPVKARSGTAL